MRDSCIRGLLGTGRQVHQLSVAAARGACLQDHGQPWEGFDRQHNSQRSQQLSPMPWDHARVGGDGRAAHASAVLKQHARALHDTGQVPGGPPDDTYDDATLDYFDDAEPPEAYGGIYAMPEVAPVMEPVEDEGLTIVHTAAELQQAIIEGARDIEIRSHLDLTSLNRTVTQAPFALRNPISDKRTHLMYVKAQTRSIRVRLHPFSNLQRPPPHALPPRMVSMHAYPGISLATSRPHSSPVLCTSSMATLHLTADGRTAAPPHHSSPERVTSPHRAIQLCISVGKSRPSGHMSDAHACPNRVVPFVSSSHACPLYPPCGSHRSSNVPSTPTKTLIHGRYRGCAGKLP